MLVDEIPDRTNDPNYLYGRWLSSPEDGEEVVISGMSGRLPESNTVYEFQDHLFNKEEMVSDDDRRWKLDHPEIPQRTAKIYNIDKYDAGYFGVHHRQATSMDPMMRTFMETAIEAIMDAGVNPKELEGTKTGVFVSTSWSDMENDTLVSITEAERFGVTGYLRSFIAHRLSYYLKLKGPACIMDTACSSSMNAFDAAFKAIRGGKCDNVIVGCTNLLLHPGNSLQFFRLGVLSIDGVCRVFDQDASGYVRGETVACIFLQKAKNSRRIYAKVINTKVNGDGFKEQGITFPSTLAQKILMTEIYHESGIPASELSFLEAHGTGTQVGDPQEVEAIDSALARRRNAPLLVGSVKSSIGHTEPASGVCSIIKVLITMQTGIITPNINLKRIKEGMKGFEEGRMKAVTELTELKEDDAVIGINNFGFGGNNAHAILRRYNKIKVSGGVPSDDLPRLVCVSGRTKDAVQKLLTNLKIDADHLHRGYSIISKNGLVKTSSKLLDSQSPLYVFFGQFDNNFRLLGLYLSEFPIFEKTVGRINKLLEQKNLKTFDQILKNRTERRYDVLGSICVQIGIIDILKELDVSPTAVYADSYAKLISAYHYDSINFEETLSAAVKISELDFDSDVHFQSSFNNFAKMDVLTNDKVPKNTMVLNVSDSRLSDRDMLMVESGTVLFLDILGRLYENGYTPQLHKLYPEVEYPVSCGTGMISPMVDWSHDKSWHTYKFSEFTASDAEQREYNISYLYDEHKFIAGHVIDGRNLFPATEYLRFVWETFAQSRRLLVADLPVIFTDCRFIRAVTMPKAGFVKLLVTIQRGSGYFEVLEKNSLVVSGYIHSGSEESDLQPIQYDEDDPLQVLQQDEIYREMYLRGYNYSGLFKGIEKCNVDASAGLIKWENNWCTFMDKMLQMKILQVDTRLLYVPVGIKKLSVNPLKHLEVAAQTGEEEPLIPVYVYKDANVIKSGGIEVSGLQAKSISKKKPRLEPVLEKYHFVPNSSSLPLPDAIRVNTQIILENTLETQFKAVEIIDDFTKPNCDFLLHLVCKALDDIPVVTPELTISSKTEIEEFPGVKVEDVTLTSESNLLLIVGTKLLQRASLKQIMISLRTNGFVLSREDVDFVPESTNDVEILTVYRTENEKIVLFRRSQPVPNPKFIEVSSSNFEWLTQLRSSLKSEDNVIVYSKNKEIEGTLGLVNCLRREPNGNKVKCFFTMDEILEFDPRKYEEQVKKNFAVNIFKDGTWGTYRHLHLDKALEVECEHCFANVTNRGDISSFKWLQGGLTSSIPVQKGRVLISTYYSAVNFKDIMAASGRVNVEALTNSRLDHECPIGFEFSGKDPSGRRVTGMIDNKALSSYVLGDSSFLWEIPDSWSLEDGATVPVVYSTVLYALLMVGEMKRGSSILIHSATGGIGLAALNVCLYNNCNIYVTVGTQEKRDYLKKHYPQILDSHVGNSRDLSFEDMIKTETKGRGVDFVLNSLADDKLKASVRCLAKGGCLLEIGKFDLANDTSLNLLFMEREASYHGIMLDRIIFNSEEKKRELYDIIYTGIKQGFVKPLPHVVFQKEEVEASYRFMMTGKHIGKVLVKIRDEEKDKSVVPQKLTFLAKRRFNCDVRNSYVIIGGLGGVGLELADWLVLRGARKLVLVSRSGVQSGYQVQRIGLWKSYGVDVRISTKDVTTRKGCTELLTEAKTLGPVDAIFNLAVVLKDALFEEQSEESFLASLAPKAQATVFLDQVTRELCPQLRHFVIFSSVSCGRGNAGQTNYGMANSIMERICEKRRLEGLPAVAIQWGAIGDVGLVAKMQKENKELVIGGTLQQKISSCLEVLDSFLTQNHPIVSSMVVAEKHNRSYGLISAVEAVAIVLGIKDLKTVSQHSTLAELGMDSMMGTEVIQLLEKEFDIFVTAKDVRSLTFAKLGEIESEKKSNAEEKASKTQHGTNFLIQYIPDSTTSHLPVLDLKSHSNKKTVILLPGIEGVFKPCEMLHKAVEASVLGVQYSYDNPEDTVQEICANTLPHIEKNISKETPFFIIGYSFGAIAVMEIVSALEAKGYRGTVVLIDGSPTYLTSSAKDYLPEETENEFQTALVYKILSMLVPLDILSQHKEKLLKCESLLERINLGKTLIPPEIANRQKLEEQAPITLYKRFKAVISYRFTNPKIKSQVHLIKAKYPMVNEEEDYQLSKICEKEVLVTTVEGDHATMLNQPELANYVNKILN